MSAAATPTTGSFAADLHEVASTGLPEHVRDHALLLVMNALAVGAGAAGQLPAESVTRLGREHGAAITVPVVGRVERLDTLSAAMANAAAMQTTDFDDTHLDTVIHPTSTCLPAALSAGLLTGVDGAAFLTAVAIGSEAQLRVGLAMPGHYEKGWHITSTTGVVGAAVSAGLCLGLTPDQLHHAIAIAASQSVGHRSAFGTDVKPLQAGKSSANGLLAALLARDGFTGARRALEGPRGYFRVLAPDGADLDSLTVRDRPWELLRVTVKPYPCGVVSHPAIDASLALARGEAVDPDLVERVEVHCHPLVPELTGRTRPATGLEARFSTAHAVACALVTGELTDESYADAAVGRADIARVRERVVLVPATDRSRESASVTVQLSDGRSRSHDVRSCRGSSMNPLSAAEVEDKVTMLIERRMPGRSAVLIARVRDLPTAESLDPLAAALPADVDSPASRTVR